MPAQGQEDIQVDDESSERMKHIAELLEITGAKNINAAVELRLVAMKDKKKSNITSLAKAVIKKASTASVELEEEDKHSTRGTMATALAASKLKARVKVSHHRRLLGCFCRPCSDCMRVLSLTVTCALQD